MNNNNKLKILVGVLFCFIIILVALLIYAKLVYVNNENPASTISSADSSSQTGNSKTTEVSAQSSSDASEVNQTIDLQLYLFDADDYNNVKEIQKVTVDKKLYQDDITAAINKVLSATNININKASINGKSITVDLPKEVAMKFNNGSAAGITYTNILAMTMLNLPDIDKLEITVDGVIGVVADHFNFNGEFIKANDGKKYTFTESEKKSNELK